MSGFVSIQIVDYVGSFAENKDLAKSIREEQIVPILREDKIAVLDFSHVNSTTQSFVHALISELIRVYGIDVLDKIIFKSCNHAVRDIISIVTEYMQQYSVEPNRK